jgi:hypothetical protein
MAAQLNPHDWCGVESDISLHKVCYVNELINQSYGGDISVDVGIIYISVGCNGGRDPQRFLLFLPYYNPHVQAYSFNIQYQYIFARGFPCRVSADFYAFLDEKWTSQISTVDENNSLMECSPVLLASFESCLDSSFQALSWEASTRTEGSLAIKKSPLECWIHGPISSESRIVRDIKQAEGREFLNLLNGSTAKVDDLVKKIEPLMAKCNSFSFPTIHMSITSPMTGLVPFPLKDVLLKFGGERTKDVTYFPVANPVPGHIARTHFQPHLYCQSAVITAPIARTSGKPQSSAHPCLYCHH